MNNQDIFGRLVSLHDEGQRAQVLETLIDHLESSGQFHELFEALKMKLRFDLGLPAAQAEQEDRLGDETESRLEQGLILACRRVGEAFVRAGKVPEGWMYLRPVGDRGLAAQLLNAIQPDEDNYQDLINVLVHEAVDVRRGYRIALERLGTCNCITIFEQSLVTRPRCDQQAAADLLVRHVHRELLGNLRADIERRTGALPQDLWAESLLDTHPNLLKDGTYHLDTSHLAATVRFARVLDDPEPLRLALDIAIYGSKLHPQYQYPGEEPFLDLYPASIIFFRALLGQNVDAAIRYFTTKADKVDQQHYGLLAVEILIDLLSRCGRYPEAILEHRQRIDQGARTMGISPSLLQLSQRLGNFDVMREICRERGDLLSFTAALMHS
jgi:hypothetical protein